MLALHRFSLLPCSSALAPAWPGENDRFLRFPVGLARRRILHCEGKLSASPSPSPFSSRRENCCCRLFNARTLCGSPWLCLVTKHPCSNGHLHPCLCRSLMTVGLPVVPHGRCVFQWAWLGGASCIARHWLGRWYKQPIMQTSHARRCSTAMRSSCFRKQQHNVVFHDLQ